MHALYEKEVALRHKAPAEKLAVIGYVGVLLLVFVTLHPFAPRVTSNIYSPHSSDTLHVFLSIFIFLIILTAAFFKRGLSFVRAIPWTLGILLIWCFASAAAAINSDTVILRAGAEMLFSLSVLLCVDNLGYERAGRMLGYFLLTVLVINCLSIPIIRTAVHLPGESDPSLIGDWRGLYEQKNATGAVTALTILLMIFFGPIQSKLFKTLWIMLALGFLVMTHSKTSMAILPVAAILGGFYAISWRNGLSRAIFIIGALLISVIFTTALLLNSESILRIFEDPAEFTGRTEIWSANLAFIHDHFWLGGGDGVVTSSSGASYLQNYVSSSWVRAIGSSHNGYIDVAVNLGVIGLILASGALIVSPLYFLWPLESQGASRAGFFAIIVFVLLHNLAESDFLATDNPVWFAFLFAIAGLSERMNELDYGRQAGRQIF